MPESVTDRCTKAHEYVFLLTKSARYYYDDDAVRERSAAMDGMVGTHRRNANEADTLTRLRNGVTEATVWSMPINMRTRGRSQQAIRVEYHHETIQRRTLRRHA
jgi:hypothetical protein